MPNNRYWQWAVVVKGPPPLVHLWQNPESIRDVNISNAKLAQEAPLWCLVAGVGVSLWAILTAPHPSLRLPGNTALRNHRSDASPATGPFSGGCQAVRGGGLLRACRTARASESPESGFFARPVIQTSTDSWMCRLVFRACARATPRAGSSSRTA